MNYVSWNSVFAIITFFLFRWKSIGYSFGKLKTCLLSFIISFCLAKTWRYGNSFSWNSILKPSRFERCFFRFLNISLLWWTWVFTTHIFSWSALLYEKRASFSNITVFLFAYEFRPCLLFIIEFPLSDRFMFIFFHAVAHAESCAEPISSYALKSCYLLNMFQ